MSQPSAAPRQPERPLAADLDFLPQLVPGSRPAVRTSPRSGRSAGTGRTGPRSATSR